MRRTVAVLMLCASLVAPASAFDHGFPKDTDRSEFFKQLKRPDYYPHPCCGESDGYEADIYKRNPDGSYDVVITEGSAKTFPDGSTRPELPNGSKVHVPATQINPPTETKNNPTGHAWLFVSIRRSYANGADNEATPGMTYCFVPLPEGS